MSANYLSSLLKSNLSDASRAAYSVRNGMSMYINNEAVMKEGMSLMSIDMKQPTCSLFDMASGHVVEGVFIRNYYRYSVIINALERYNKYLDIKESLEKLQLLSDHFRKHIPEAGHKMIMTPDLDMVIKTMMRYHLACHMNIYFPDIPKYTGIVYDLKAYLPRLDQYHWALITQNITSFIDSMTTHLSHIKPPIVITPDTTVGEYLAALHYDLSGFYA